MKTLAVTQLRKIAGGKHFGFNAVQDPMMLTIGPGITNPEPPIDDVTPGILQKMMPLVRMNIVTFSS